MDLVHLVLESVVFVSIQRLVHVLSFIFYLYFILDVSLVHIIIVFQLPWHVEQVPVRIKRIWFKLQ